MIGQIVQCFFPITASFCFFLLAFHFFSPIFPVLRLSSLDRL